MTLEDLWKQNSEKFPFNFLDQEGNGWTAIGVVPWDVDRFVAAKRDGALLRFGKTYVALVEDKPKPKVSSLYGICVPHYPTRRDWFAGLALAGAIANDPGDSSGDYAAGACTYADALIAELDKK